MRALWAVLAMAAITMVAAPARAQDAEADLWARVQSCAQIDAFLATYPNGRFAAEARAKARALNCDGAAAGSPSPDASPARQRTGATRGLQPPAPGGAGAVIGGATGATRGLGAPQATEVRPKLVMLARSQERRDNAGGHAVVLLRNAPAAATRNRLLCQSVQRRFDDATYAEIQVGVERLPDGRIAALRPIYWPLNSAIPAGAGDRCAQRLAQYDYTRAAAIIDKLDLRDAGAGPFLVVSRDDQRQAAMINMSALTPQQIDPMVVFFRDRFSQKQDIWSPSVNTVSQRQSGLMASFPSDFSQSLLRSISLFTATSSLGGCIGDPSDSTPCRR